MELHVSKDIIYKHHGLLVLHVLLLVNYVQMQQMLNNVWMDIMLLHLEDKMFNVIHAQHLTIWSIVIILVMLHHVHLATVQSMVLVDNVHQTH